MPHGLPLQMMLAERGTLSACIYTQITDVERECDGFYNMDRTNKFDGPTTNNIAAANQALINWHQAITN